MTTEIVTAHAGKNHVGSEDVGALYAGALGSGRFAFDVGDGLAVTMTDANTVRIGTGVFLMDGRQVRVKEAESVKVANGSQGAFRRDLVTYTYKRDPSNGNVEEGSWSVLQGTAAAKEEEAKAPGYAAGNILNGDLTATVAVAEVSLSGLNPTAKLLLPSVASLRALGDSVSHAPRGVVKREVVPVPGFTGCLAVEYCLVGGATSYDPEHALWVRLSGYPFVYNQSADDGPWGLAVKAPSGSTKWCTRIPFKATTGKEGDWSVDTSVLMVGADSGNYLTFLATSSRRLFSASDGYLYLDMYEDKPEATPIAMWFDCTLPVTRP